MPAPRPQLQPPHPNASGSVLPPATSSLDGARPAKTCEQQTSRALDPELVSRGADLCRTRPAVWLRMVRYSDQLERQGFDRREALRLALDLAEATP